VGEAVPLRAEGLLILRGSSWGTIETFKLECGKTPMMEKEFSIIGTLLRDEKSG
jgi:hypothetical protein